MGCKWIFKTTRNSIGNVVRYKMRFVAKGYTRKNRTGHEETFSPASKKDSSKNYVIAASGQITVTTNGCKNSFFVWIF